MAEESELRSPGSLGPSEKPPVHVGRRTVLGVLGLAGIGILAGAKIDNALTFDKLTDVFNSGTIHEEDQPCHLKVSDTNVCRERCTVEYGNPCQYFCPAQVYEPMFEKNEAGAVEGRLQINFTNCVHCKTCDIADPYQIITWVPPQGGEGPVYTGM